MLGSLNAAAKTRIAQVWDETTNTVGTDAAVVPVGLGDRLGGHLVSGHVDAVAEVAKVTERGASQEFWLTFPQELAAQLAPKGSVALDGISLTINACLPDRFSVNIIPETLRATTAALWRPGSRVNLETDPLAKYVARYLEFTGKNGAGDSAEETGESGLTLEFLRQQGF